MEELVPREELLVNGNQFIHPDMTALSAHVSEQVTRVSYNVLFSGRFQPNFPI
jgi:hypothetical protein